MSCAHGEAKYVCKWGNCIMGPGSGYCNDGRFCYFYGSFCMGGSTLDEYWAAWPPGDPNSPECLTGKCTFRGEPPASGCVDNPIIDCGQVYHQLKYYRRIGELEWVGEDEPENFGKPCNQESCCE